MVNDAHRMIYYEPDDDPDLEQGALSYLGNGALLIDYGNIRVLVDSSRGIDGSTLPAGAKALNAILLSSLEGGGELAADDGIDRDVPVITNLDLVDTLERSAFENVHPLDTWRRIVLRKGDASITITALPGQQPASASLPTMGSMLEFRGRPDADPYRLYLSGGTAGIDLLDEIPVRFPRIDLGVIALACTRLAGTIVAIDAGQGIDVLARVRPALAVPVHRFDDRFTWPLRDFQQALRRAALSTCIRYLAPGERHIFTVLARPGRPREPWLPAPSGAGAAALASPG